MGDRVFFPQVIPNTRYHCDFILNTPNNKRQQSLHAWLRILGYTNWALNAFPILKPALNSSYDKVTGKTVLSQAVYINKDV